VSARVSLARSRHRRACAERRVRRRDDDRHIIPTRENNNAIVLPSTPRRLNDSDHRRPSAYMCRLLIVFLLNKTNITSRTCRECLTAPMPAVDAAAAPAGRIHMFISVSRIPAVYMYNITMHKHYTSMPTCVHTSHTRSSLRRHSRSPSIHTLLYTHIVLYRSPFDLHALPAARNIAIRLKNRTRPFSSRRARLHCESFETT
jgi:hypothetical protein